MHPELLDLSTWLPKHLKDLWGDHPRDAAIRVTVPPVPTPIRIDPDSLARVLRILTDNAFQHGMLATRVYFTLSQRGNDILLTVENEGKNIPEADRANVFQQPGKNLTLAAQLVREVGGKIVALPSQIGARIALLLPAATE